MSEDLLKYLDGSNYHDTLTDDVNDSINETLRKFKSNCKYKIPDHCTAKERKIKGRKKYLQRKFKKMLEDKIMY